MRNTISMFKKIVDETNELVKSSKLKGKALSIQNTNLINVQKSFEKLKSIKSITNQWSLKDYDMRRTVNGIGGNSNCQPFRDMQQSFNTNEPILFKMKDLIHNRRILNANFNSSDLS